MPASMQICWPPEDRAVRGHHGRTRHHRPPLRRSPVQVGQGRPGCAAAWLEPLAAVAGNAQLQQFAGNPKVTDQQVFDVIAGVSKTALPETGKNFLRTVIENGRLDALPEIAAQFRAAQERAGRVV
jgi:hypothetical protein